MNLFLLQAATNIKDETVRNIDAVGRAIKTYLDMAIAYAPKIIIAFILLWIGFGIINWIVKSLNNALNKQSYDSTVTRFFSSLINILMKAALFIAVASMLGINTTSFIAILGAAGLAIGLALQGNLSNFAAGFILVLFKPFKAGDYVKINGVEGFVEEVSIFSSKIITPDRITHFVPNASITSGNITNVSQQGVVRLHIPVGISYDADIDEARATLLKMAKQNPLVVNEPAPSIIITGLGDSSVDLEVLVWCNPLEKPRVMTAMFEGIKKSLDAANIEIPFPQRVLHNPN